MVNEIAPLVWCRLLDPRQVRFVHLSKTDPGRWPTAKALTQRLDRTAGYSWSSTPANVHEAVHTSAIHEALSEAELAPSEHLIDAAYVSAEHWGRPTPGTGSTSSARRGPITAGSGGLPRRARWRTSSSTESTTACAARRAMRARTGVRTGTRRMAARSSEPASALAIVILVRPSRAVPERRVAGWRCIRVPSTRRWRQRAGSRRVSRASDLQSWPQHCHPPDVRHRCSSRVLQKLHI